MSWKKRRTTTPRSISERPPSPYPKDMENGVSVTASWPFRGTYSEKDIPEIKAAGVIKAE